MKEKLCASSILFGEEPTEKFMREFIITHVIKGKKTVSLKMDEISDENPDGYLLTISAE